MKTSAAGFGESGNELAKTHQTALRILSELGVRVAHAEMRERLEGRGCRLSGERVYMPPGLVTETAERIPSDLRLYGRDAKSAAHVRSAGPTLFTNTGILPNIVDFETGAVRRSVTADVERTTRVLDGLPEVDVVYVSLVGATELPSHMATITDFVSTLRNTDKPLIGPGLSTAAETTAVVDMALALRGGDSRALAEKPPCAPFVTAITPLYLPRDTVEALEVIARAGLPLVALTNPVMGTTSPYTIGGTVCLGHAEVLAMAVLAHAVRPGLPVVSINTPSVADMRTMGSTTGGPETGLMRRLAVEIDNSLGIPTWAHGHTSSALLDEQASDEKSINCMLIAGARPSLLGGLGGLANVTLTSYETMIVDNERLGAIRRVLGGIALDQDHLAYDVIADLVRGESVIVHEHTIRHLRSDEVWRPGLARRQGLAEGKPQAETMGKRAREAARRIMADHTVAPLADDVLRAFEEIRARYDRSVRTG